MPKALIYLLSSFAYLIIIYNAEAYNFIDGKEFNKWIKEPIPFESGEKVLMGEGKKRVGNIVYLIMHPYVKVKDSLVSIIKDKYGYNNNIERISDESKGWQNRYDKDWIEKDLQQARALNVNIERYKESCITTNRYNINEEKKQYSELFINIIDGKDVFGYTCTIVILSRVDHWLDWPREFHTGIPIPIKKDNIETKLITNTETNIIDQMKIKSGVEYSKYYFTYLDSWYLRDINMLGSIKRDILSYGNNK